MQQPTMEAALVFLMASVDGFVTAVAAMQQNVLIIGTVSKPTALAVL